MCRFVIKATNTSARVFALHLEGWDRYVWLDAETDFVSPRAPPTQWPVLSGFLPPMFDISPDLAATIIAHNVAYHLRLGFHKFYVYCTKAMLPSYAAHARLAALQRTQQVELVLFDALPQCRRRSGCYKPLASAHAVLGLWGSGEHVTIADPDELLALRPGQTLSAFMREVGNQPLVRLRRFNVICSNCVGEELDMWRLSEGGPSPLLQYSTLTGHEPGSAGKCVVNPDLVHGFAIHTGSILAGGSSVELAQEHAYFVHLINLFRNRVSHNPWDKEFSSWQWPLRTAA